MLIKKIFHFEIAEKNSINAYLIHIMMSESLTLCTLIRLKKIYKKNKKQIPVPLLNSQGYHARAAANDMNISNNEQNFIYTCFVSPI